MTAKRGEIWYANLNPVQGSEQAGVGPVLIFQNDKINKAAITTLVIPLTTNLRRAALPSCVQVAKGEGGLTDVCRDIISVMLTTYEAILHGNLLEWRKDVPQQITAGQAVNVHVTILDELPVTERQGQRMATALSKLAQSQTLAGVDAQAWERETRIDKPLAGRSE